MHKDAIAIVSQFNAEIRGLYNFYSMAENVSVLNNFVHMDFLGYSSAQFANASFQPSCEAVRLVIFHILRKNIGGQKRKVFLFSETIMIKLALLGAVLGCVAGSGGGVAKTACESKYGVAMPTL